MSNSEQLVLNKKDEYLLFFDNSCAILKRKKYQRINSALYFLGEEVFELKNRMILLGRNSLVQSEYLLWQFF